MEKLGPFNASSPHLCVKAELSSSEISSLLKLSPLWILWCLLKDELTLESQHIIQSKNQLTMRHVSTENRIHSFGN